LKENLHTEFKSSFNDSVIETLVAFANSNGGNVLVGLNDKGLPIKGFKIGEETFQKWINEIKNKTQPSIIPDIKLIKLKGQQVVSISIQEFPVKPVSFKGRYYKRIKNSNHQLSPIEITDLNIQSLQLSWDAYPSDGITQKDLDSKKITKFISKVNTIGRFKLEGTNIECLEKLRLVSKNKITNAALLLFAKSTIKYNVHLGRFKTPSHIIDDKMLQGTLFEAVEDTMKYIVSQIKVAFEITGKTTQRTEIFEYPLPALRELVLNALIHRDYLSPIDVQIKIFDNSITFFNPGKLYGSLTVNDLKTNSYQAYTRNKLIAEAFYLTGDIEKYGSGFMRIREELKQYPTMQLICEEIPNGFLATLTYTKQKTSVNTQSKVGDKVGEKVGDKVGDKVGEKVGENISVNQKAILRLIASKPDISAPEMAKKIGISIRKTEENIRKLREMNKLIRVGPAKGGHWEIIENEM